MGPLGYKGKGRGFSWFFVFRRYYVDSGVILGGFTDFYAKHIANRAAVRRLSGEASSRRKEKEPDVLIIFRSGLKLAIEVETSISNLAYYKRLISYYRYDIEVAHKYHAVLFIAPNKYNCECIKKRLFYLNSELYKKAFVFSDLEALKLGGCFYQDAARDLKETLILLEQSKNIDTSQR